jgi:hypothetical protein
MDIVMAEHRIEGEQHDAHAEAEIAAIDIDDEFQNEGQPDPAPAVEIVMPLEPALDRRRQGEGDGREVSSQDIAVLNEASPSQRRPSEPQAPPMPASSSRGLR